MNKITIKRLLKDIKYIKNNPLEKERIFYFHDEKDLFKGYALIIGPKDTLYENGNYFFGEVLHGSKVDFAQLRAARQSPRN